MLMTGKHEDCEAKAKKSFFKTEYFSSNENSISFKIKNILERIKTRERNLLKETKMIPNRFIHLAQKIISLLFIIDSKLVRLSKFFK